ncbi:MAG TPA: hypothetical protein VJP88_04270 [Caulobacteraceae bacterium]|nr:hypothetical protein [Caulobacteraceae bacterium]
MTEVVIRLPIESGEEADLFSRYLNRFMERRAFEPEDSTKDAPYLILHSDPSADRELKVVTFQHRRVAQDFCTGWQEAKTELSEV